MKILVLCVCILGFALSNLAEQEIKQEIKRQFKNEVSNMEDNIETCLTENNVTRDDFYEEEQLVSDVPKEPENVERTRKLGCTIACVLKKENVMEDSNINERKVYAKINRIYPNTNDKRIVLKIARNCMKEVRNITEECEKCFSLITCGARAVHKLMGHEEHEIEDTNENEETE